MGELFTSSTFIFISFSVIGSVIVYLILLFDKKQRQKLNKVLNQTKDVQPLFMQRAASQKLTGLNQLSDPNAREARSLLSKQLSELMADYDKGKITLSDYCERLSKLRSNLG